MSSFIQFESGWEKDKARQELREVREELLKRAEQNAKKRDERDLQKQFRGDNEWMLPSVSCKIDEMSTGHKQKKEKKKKSKKSSKSKKQKKEKKKRKSKKRKHSSSSEGSDSEYSSDEKSHKRRKDSDLSDSVSESNEDEWVEKSVKEKSNEKPLEREDWLGGLSSISTFSKEPKKEKKDEKKGSIAYDPAKCARELNPYWKDGGEGLPKPFSKPKNDSDDDDYYRYRYAPKKIERHSNWRKKAETVTNTTTSSLKQSPENLSTDRRRRRSRSTSTSSKSSASDESPERKTLSPPEQVASERNHFLTDHQMNELGAKLLKAEMLGNDELVKELKEKLEKARQYRSTKKAEVFTRTYERRNDQHKDKKSKEDVLLTATNSKGYSRPVTKSHNDSDLWGGRNGRKAKKTKPIETHMDGERVRFFADDDKYNIKDMFEAEKFTSAADQDMQFANIIGKHKNPNDNLDDLFADKIRKNVDDNRDERRERDRAMKDHHNLQKTLDNCARCFDSSTFEKQLIVAMGKNVYLALPSYEGIQTGHCVIAPFLHVPCATQLDDDVWQEMRDFMKSIDRMFNARKQDVIFFETARYLHRRPHMIIHCIPNKDFEMAPFHFKKAIQESEDDWATNKQLVNLKDRDVRRAIPKGLPYFWVNFGMLNGFAHVIEDQEKFPANFAQEIVGGLLELDPRLWRRPRKLQNPIPKVKQFADWYKPYDITK